jgi:hypothetical protein
MMTGSSVINCSVVSKSIDWLELDIHGMTKRKKSCRSILLGDPATSFLELRGIRVRYKVTVQIFSPKGLVCRSDLKGK